MSSRQQQQQQQEQHQQQQQEPDSRDSDSQDVPSSSTTTTTNTGTGINGKNNAITTTGNSSHKRQKAGDGSSSPTTTSSSSAPGDESSSSSPLSSNNKRTSSSSGHGNGSSAAASAGVSSSSSSSSTSTSTSCPSPHSSSNAYNAMLGSVAASPPRFIAMEEIVKAASGVANMYLAHEIAVDENFSLPDKRSGTSADANDGSSSSSSPSCELKHKVEEMMKKAYWDILSSQLTDTPPIFKQAVALLCEVKEILQSFLLPQHTRLKQEIDEILDLDLIAQQADNGTLDFARYGQYILSVMARLCAPVRDPSIRSLTQTTDVVILFRGIMDLLDLMKLDWANFSITAIRPHLQQQSIEYEKKKFKEYLESESKITSLTGDPLMYTRVWLSRNYQSLDLSEETDDNDGDDDADDNVGSSSNAGERTPGTCVTSSGGNEKSEKEHKRMTNRVLAAAYTELLKWNDSLQDLPPETLLMDFNRFLAFRDKVCLFTLAGSVILVTMSTVGPDVQDLLEFKQTLKQHLFLILGNDNSDGPSASSSSASASRDHQHEHQLERESGKLESAALQVVREVSEVLEKHSLKSLDQIKKDLLVSQIRGLADQNNRIRKVLERRILEFIEGLIVTTTASPVQIPTGLSVFSDELLSLAGQFMRLINHNRAVFADYYTSIIQDLRQSSNSSSGGGSSCTTITK